jgi:hypothetical protein
MFLAVGDGVEFDAGRNAEKKRFENYVYQEQANIIDSVGRQLHVALILLQVFEGQVSSSSEMWSWEVPSSFLCPLEGAKCWPPHLYRQYHHYHH